MSLGARPIVHAEISYSYYWDVDTLMWVPAEQGTGGGGGGSDVQYAEGAITDPATGTVALVRGPGGDLEAIAVGENGEINVNVIGVAETVTLPVVGTFFQTTQPVSGTVTANAGSNLNTSALALDATLTSGTQKSKLVDTGGTNVASVSAGGALKVDGSAATQPVSGTVTTSPPANASTNVAQLAGTTTSVNSGVKDAGTLRVVLATDQPALTNKLLVTPDSVALPANQSVNVAQLAGTTTDTNSGVKSAGTLRVVLATDQPALTNKLLVTPDSVALPANQSVNAAQFGGTNVSTGTGAGGAGIPRVTVSNDSNVLVTPPTLTKGTQGSTGFSTQDLKDSGRIAVNYYATAAASGATTVETAITLTKASGTSATSTAVSFVVTSGKRFRIEQLLVSAVGHVTATTQATTFSLRINTAGAVVTTSTPVVWQGRIQTPATSLAYQQISLPIPNGYEILGDGTLQFGVTAKAVFVTNAPTWDVTIIGFEY